MSLTHLYHSSLVDQLTQAEQEYVRRAEEKVLQLELATTPDGRPGVVVLGGKSREAVIPTTEELSAHVHDQEALARIRQLRASAMQQADEKVAIADQTHVVIDATLEHLDNDIISMEKYVPCLSIHVYVPDSVLTITPFLCHYIDS